MEKTSGAFRRKLKMCYKNIMCINSSDILLIIYNKNAKYAFFEKNSY